ncbi:MAG: ATP-binding protein [Pseudomonas sp.]
MPVPLPFSALASRWRPNPHPGAVCPTGRRSIIVKSIQARMLAALAIILISGWLWTISTMFTTLSRSHERSWEQQFDRIGAFLLEAMPEKLVRNADSAQKRENLEGALIALTFNTIQLLITAMLMWAAVRTSLRPLHSLSAGIARRGTFDSTPITVERVPEEVRPLIASFNALLHRLEKALQDERQFIANAAHELRTPLSALHVYAEIARDATTLEEKNQALVRLLEGARRSNRLAHQLLDQARLDAGLDPAGYGQVSIGILARHVIAEFSVEAQARGVELRMRDGYCLLECDVDAIGTLIRNLVDNAIRHGREHGLVEIAWGCQPAPDGVHPFIEVSDDGPGVPPEQYETIFKRFHRLAGSESRGSGIGLALVAGIANLHGARIETGPGIGGKGLRVRALFPAIATPD